MPAEVFAETPVFVPNSNEGVVALRVAFRCQRLQLGRWRRCGGGEGQCPGPAVIDLCLLSSSTHSRIAGNDAWTLRLEMGQKRQEQQLSLHQGQFVSMLPRASRTQEIPHRCGSERVS